MGLFDGLVPKTGEVAATAAPVPTSFDPIHMIIAVGIFLGFAIIGMIIWQIYSMFCD